MAFSNEDKVLIKSLYEVKGYNTNKPVDYRIWGLMQERVYKTAVRDSPVT